ncbi:hypothetical protein V8E51_016968 [Hyaloscypha variabilis]
MAAPQAKRIKLDPDPKQPIIFTTPDMRPDVGLQVFNQQFHVYSGVLKIHSGFFRKYLEPSGGLLPTSTSPTLSSEWFTKVDADGKSWSLTSDYKFRDADTSRFSGSMAIQEEAIRKLLCAIFSRSYDIKNIYELQIMTKHADYYCCLPILSHSLAGPLYNSPGLVSTIGKAPCATLVAAYRLRHKQLFNDSFIQAMGPLKNPQYKQLKEPNLLRMAEVAYTKMCGEILKVHQGMLEIFADANTSFKDTGKAMVELADQALDEKLTVVQPMYYRLCYDHAYKSSEGAKAVRKLLGPILKNNLVLNKSKVNSGEGHFDDYFLSYNIERYPWDDTQIDW